MTFCCAIYGYECSRPFHFQGFELVPRITNQVQGKNLARDTTTYHLTAVLVGPDVTDQIAFELEVILSFIEHLDAIVTRPKKLNGSDPFSGFAETLPSQGRHSGGGATVVEDSLFQESRPKFIETCLSRLQDDEFCKRTKFKGLIFKKVETFRQRRPFIEIAYFLLYSGLEAHARAVTGNEHRSASLPIYELLNGYGFIARAEKPEKPEYLARSVWTYTQLRNALFHNGQHKREVHLKDGPVTLNIEEYFFHLEHLVSLVVMKAIGFDDGHINWDGWIDRYTFK